MFVVIMRKSMSIDDRRIRRWITTIVIALGLANHYQCEQIESSKFECHPQVFPKNIVFLDHRVALRIILKICMFLYFFQSFFRLKKILPAYY